MTDSSRRFFGGSGDDSRDQLPIPKKKRSDRTSFSRLGDGASGSRSAKDRSLLFATDEQRSTFRKGEPHSQQGGETLRGDSPRSMVEFSPDSSNTEQVGTSTYFLRSESGGDSNKNTIDRKRQRNDNDSLLENQPNLKRLSTHRVSEEKNREIDTFLCSSSYEKQEITYFAMTNAGAHAIEKMNREEIRDLQSFRVKRKKGENPTIEERFAFNKYNRLLDRYYKKHKCKKSVFGKLHAISDNNKLNSYKKQREEGYTHEQIEEFFDQGHIIEKEYIKIYEKNKKAARKYIDNLSLSQKEAYKTFKRFKRYCRIDKARKEYQEFCNSQRESASHGENGLGAETRRSQDLPSFDRLATDTLSRTAASSGERQAARGNESGGKWHELLKVASRESSEHTASPQPINAFLFGSDEERARISQWENNIASKFSLLRDLYKKNAYYAEPFLTVTLSEPHRKVVRQLVKDFLSSERFVPFDTMKGKFWKETEKLRKSSQEKNEANHEITYKAFLQYCNYLLELDAPT